MAHADLAEVTRMAVDCKEKNCQLETFGACNFDTTKSKHCYRFINVTSMSLTTSKKSLDKTIVHIYNIIGSFSTVT